ncbi:hypothetical protein ACVRWQ_04050 [Streptococcus phocae subsp. salmonis]|uniref:hypothetical protein n=1 Tax=Streptococcus phocae TaxID=119224 RepID=UPI00053179B2|nr:hypothetical protein [Streptococcus phocae]KGR72182.1 hypothetical protein NX86_07750 [Streptococcus phocae subsp. salmonis]
MSKYKIAAITAIAAMSLLTGATASADEVIQGIISYPEGYRTMPQVSEKNFINIAPLGGRGSEGLSAEIISGILKHIQCL